MSVWVNEWLSSWHWLHFHMTHFLPHLIRAAMLCKQFYVSRLLPCCLFLCLLACLLAIASSFLKSNLFICVCVVLCCFNMAGLEGRFLGAAARALHWLPLWRGGARVEDISSVGDTGVATLYYCIDQKTIFLVTVRKLASLPPHHLSPFGQQ